MQVFNFFINNWDKILTIMVGLVAIIIYKIQKRDEKKNAAILIVTQIDDLKDKISQIVELTTNNQLNAAGIYETLDILEENQWNKYKHLFVGSIDIKSLKIINDFYEGVSLIREQLVLSKKLQQQAFFNNQQFLGQDCNMYLIESLNEKDRFNYTGIKDALNNMPEEGENAKNIKDSLLKIAEIQLPPNIDKTQYMNKYITKTDELKNIFGKQGIFISYLPEQVYITIEKELKKLSHIEIMGCMGYKKIRKISKIK